MDNTNDDEKFNLLPYIIHNISNNKYLAYIPYEISDINMRIHCVAPYDISAYLDLPTDMSPYSPSYTYIYSDTIFEIGIIGYDLDKIYKTIKNIQQKLIKKNCKVDTNLEKITIEISD